MPAANRWVIFNVQETGYYKVNYDEQNWNMISSQLTSDHGAIHAINRAQVRLISQQSPTGENQNRRKWSDALSV